MGKIITMWRVAFVVILVMLGMGFDFLWSTVAQPEVSTTLALEQFANPSVATDTLERSVNRANPSVFYYLGVGLVTVMLFRKELVEIFKGN